MFIRAFLPKMSPRSASAFIRSALARVCSALGFLVAAFFAAGGSGSPVFAVFASGFLSRPSVSATLNSSTDIAVIGPTFQPLS